MKFSIDPRMFERFPEVTIGVIVVQDINTLVDLYNALSLIFMLPMGGEDLDKAHGDIRLTFADGTGAKQIVRN